ncbi:MAG: hypothetical protein ABIR65_01260 [Pseudolysinimonas sp.]
MIKRNLLETVLRVTLVIVLAACGIALCLAAKAHAADVAATVTATPADALHDPLVAPAAAFDDVRAAQKIGWPLAVLAVLVMLSRVLGGAGTRWSVPWLAWLAKGTAAFVVGGLGSVSAAAFNALALGGTWFAVVAAAVGAGLALTSPTTRPVAAQPGFARLGVLLAIAALTTGLLASTGCATLKRTAGAAVGALVDCTAPKLRARIAQVEPAVRPMLVELAQLEHPDASALRGLVRNLDGEIRTCALPVIGAAVAAFLESAPRTHAQQIDPAKVRALVREVADAELGGAHFVTANGTL